MGRASCGGVSGITGRIRAVESADAVEAEAIGAVVGPVEDGRRGITGHRLTSPLQPAAVLSALAFERPPKGERQRLYRFLTCTHSVGAPVPCLPLGFVGDVVTRPALVLAERSHLEVRLIAALSLQHSIRHRGRGQTAELAEGFWERPETVFHAGQGIIFTCGRRDGDGKERYERQSVCTISNFFSPETGCNIRQSCF